MGKNTTGGKKHKKAKNSIVERTLEEADNIFQFYSIVNKKLGGGRFSVDVYIPERIDKKKNKVIRHEEIKTDQIALLRGSLRKRARIDVGTLVIVSLREFQDKKVDIIHAYKGNEVQKLRRRKILPECKIFENSVDSEINFQEENSDSELFEDDHNKNRGAYTRGAYTSNYDLIPDNSENEDED